MRRERVKGKLEVAIAGKTNNVRTQAQVQAQIPEITVFLCRIEGFGRGLGQGARNGGSEKRRTFGQVVLLGCIVGGVGWGIVSIGTCRGECDRLTVFGCVHFGSFRLGLREGLEHFGVQTFGARLLDGPEYFGAELGAVRFFAARAETFCHCEGWFGGVLVKNGQAEVFVVDECLADLGLCGSAEWGKSSGIILVARPVEARQPARALVAFFA